MPEAYTNEELRLVQEVSFTSAANALYRDAGPVPQGKIWTVIGIGYQPSVAETQVVSFEKVTRSGSSVAIYNPTSLNLNPAYATGVEAGYTVQLLPGEYIAVRRVAATAGSTMALRLQFVESDLPLYDYTEPQAAARIKRAVTSMAERVTRYGGGRGGGGGGSVGARPGGRSGPLPK